MRFGSWALGAELADCILAEFRHRWNIRASQKHRLGYPNVGHYDTWLEDKLQELYLANYGRPLHQYWTSASDYRPTAERFGIIKLHEGAMDFPKLITPKLTRDQAYLAHCQELPAPCLPITSKEEMKLFNTMAIRTGVDFKRMARTITLTLIYL